MRTEARPICLIFASALSATAPGSLAAQVPKDIPPPVLPPTLLLAGETGRTNNVAVLPPVLPPSLLDPAQRQPDTPPSDDQERLPIEAELLPELKGIRFVASEDALAESPVTLDSVLERSQVPALADQAFEQEMAAFLGQPVSRLTLKTLESTVRIYLSMRSRPFSVAYLPPQDISTGYLQMVVTAAVADQTVAVEGARHFDAGLYRRWVRQPAGQPLDMAALNEDISWINRNPYRQARPTVRRGSRPGTTELVVAVQERRPWQAFSRLSNTGSQSTDRERWAVGVDWGNAFGLGHQLNLNWSAAVDVERSRSASLSYTLPLPWRHLLRFSGAWSESSSKVPADLDQSGTGRQAGLGYEIPLRGSPAHQHYIRISGDYKRNDNLLLLLLGIDNVPLTEGSTEVVQFTVGYDRRAALLGGTLSLGLAAIVSPGELARKNDDAAFAGSRAGARADYSYLTAHARHARAFGQGRWEWSLAINGQWTDDTLIGSEQIAAGGMGSVRGYDESEAFGDRGFVLAQELALPVLHPLGTGADQLRFFLFQEGARISNTHKLPGESATHLHAAGTGLRYAYRRFLSIDLALGVPLRDADRLEESDPAGHFSLQLNY